jgi:hypothetical protein
MGDAIQFATEIAIGLHSKEEAANKPEPARPVLRFRGAEDARLRSSASHPALLAMSA